MKLIIVESPTKARTLNRFLGSEYAVHATMGHIKDLPKSKLSVDIENGFKPDYAVVSKKRDVIAEIRNAAKEAGEIYIATDPDREGEAIAMHVQDILTQKVSKNGKVTKIAKTKEDKIKRIVFHEITKNAVDDAIAHPGKVDKALVDAQTARRVLDRLVGYKLSPLLWKKVRRGLSAGRVQSVAVRLIVEKEREIEAFKAVEYWELYAIVKSAKEKAQSNKFSVQLARIGDKKAEVNNEKQAKEILTDLEKATYFVSDVVKKEVRKGPYPPFTTSTLTQAGSRLFGWSAKRTMSIAQKLYEQGLITYHRTDSTNISKEAIAKLRPFVEKQFGKDYIPENPRFYKTKAKVAQEAHEAIRPTHVAKEVNGDVRPEEKKLYDLVWKRFVASQMSDSVFDETKISVTAKNNREYLLRASGQVMKFDGWRKVMPLKATEDTVVSLPNVVKDEALDLISLDPQQKFTQPPARFNEASLIKTLEKLGIGRPSTYAPTISTIQDRQYVEKTEGKFFPTSVGMAVNDFLVSNFPAEVEYSFTAKMEDSLDNIAKGEEKWKDVIGTFWKPFEKKLTSVEKDAKRVKIETEKLGRKCPECKEGELVIRLGRFGKFISCERFPDCKYTEKYIEKIDMKCPDCGKGDVVVKRTGKGRTFFGCSTYPDCKWASWTNPQKKADAIETESAS